MPIHLRPLADAEVPLMMSIQSRALTTGIWAHYWGPGVLDVYTRLQHKAIKKPESYYFGVIDDSSEEMLGVGRFMIYPEGKTEQTIKESSEPPEIHDLGTPQREVWDVVGGMRSGIMGTKPYIQVSLVATLPEHQRKGVGKALMNWVCKQGDERGLEILLEATEAGRPLYLQYGFVPGQEYHFDLSKYGGQGTDRITAMVRQPVKQSA